ncbi:MAG: hypothetical protein M0R51_10845 [Clostridia bacterium]|jgi:hypothetical protein|nr:hypothetical protein [Clostridia bacterium]
MIELNDFKTAISQILNGTYSGTTLPTRPSDEYFKVKTYADYLDTIADKTTKKNFIPVLIHSPSGSYEPIPTLALCDQSYVVEIYFPIRKKDTIIQFGDYLAQAVCGKQLAFGSSLAVCNTDVGVFGQVQPQAMEQFISFVNDSYQLLIQKSDMWGSLQITFYIASSLVGIFGNQVSYSLSMTPSAGGTALTETLIIVDSSHTQNSTPASQQLISGTYAKAIITNTAFGKSLTVFPRVNAFWKHFIWEFNSKTLQSALWSLTKTYSGVFVAGDSPKTGVYTTTLLLLDVQENIQLGKPISYTLTYTEKV